MKKLASSLTLLCLTACSSGPKAFDLVDSTPAFDGFPAQALEGIVYAQAAFDDYYDETFRVDLVDRGIVPVKVTMQLRGHGQDNAQIMIKPRRMDARLYLIDGTVLPLVPADRVASSLKEKPERLVREHAFEGGLLSAEPTEGYLFFSLTPREAFEAEGRSVVHRDGDIERRLDLAHSLLAFDVMVENTPHPFYVGIQR